jgi:hypothetical protein
MTQTVCAPDAKTVRTTVTAGSTKHLVPVGDIPSRNGNPSRRRGYLSGAHTLVGDRDRLWDVWA